MIIRPPPSPTPVPYTTLFRSRAREDPEGDLPLGRGVHGVAAPRRPPPERLHRGGLRQGLRVPARRDRQGREDRKSTRLNSSHGYISYAVFCLKKKHVEFGLFP